MITGCGIIGRHDSSSDVEDANFDIGMSQTDHTTTSSQKVDITSDLDDSDDYYEYYLTDKELIADIGQGYDFNLDTALQKRQWLKLNLKGKI